MAWNAEAAYRIVPELEIAGRAEGSREFFDHPKLQVGLDVSWSAYPGITLSASYLRGLFDEDFAAGLESRDRFVFQMAAEL